jgi:hypothetical protein
VTLAEKHADKKIIKTHSLIHKEVLCSRLLDFERVMSAVVSVVKFIRSRKLNHRLLRAFLEAVGTNYSDLLCHAEVRCMNRQWKGAATFCSTQGRNSSVLGKLSKKVPTASRREVEQ